MERTDILRLVGHTPLVEIRRLNPHPHVKIMAKIESMNPGGSIKDRVAVAMIEAAEATGQLTPDEAAWEANRLNIILANKGYTDSEVTRWWNFTRHRELGDQTVDEAWRDGRYTAVSRLIQSLPDKHELDGGRPGA